MAWCFTDFITTSPEIQSGNQAKACPSRTLRTRGLGQPQPASPKRQINGKTTRVFGWSRILHLHGARWNNKERALLHSSVHSFSLYTSTIPYLMKKIAFIWGVLRSRNPSINLWIAVPAPLSIANSTRQDDPAGSPIYDHH